METFLYIAFFVSCVLLIVAVLLQPGKTDAGALFTSNISSSALNPRGTQSVLSKLTIAMAAMFMLSALLLSLPAITGKVSVLQTQGEGGPANTAEGAANTNADNTQNAAPANTAPANSGDAEGASNAEAKPAEENKAPAEGGEKGGN